MADKESGSLLNESFSCIADELKGKESCNSSDALKVYEHDGEDGKLHYDAYCFSCCQYFNKTEVANTSLADQLGLEDGVVKDKPKFTKLSKVPPMSKEDIKEFRKTLTYNTNDYRGIKDEYSKFFGHMAKVDRNGNVLAKYYPETKESEVVGYKCRNHPKDFRYGKRGTTGLSCELSGQVRFKSGGKYLLIVGGEEDKVAAFQMLRDYQIGKGQGDYEAIAVVSPTCGEGNAARQVANEYDFCDEFENILIGMDNDEAGKKATEEIIKVLPAEKVKIITWSGKDPNKMLNDGKEKQFLRDFYNAKPVINTGIRSSAGVMDDVYEELLRPRIPLPPYMHEMAAMMGGGSTPGPQQGRIINIIGNTSVGKSSHVNNMVYHWIFNSPVKPGVVSLEATCGQYTLDLLSIHLERNLVRIGEGKDIVEYLQRPDVASLRDDLLVNEDGEPRWAILDERDGDIKELEKQMEKLVKQHGCKLIVVDVLTDILRGMPIEQQENHLKFQKAMVKGGVTIVNVLHTIKPRADKDGKVRKVNEYDALGSGTFVQSAAYNIVIDRDKMAEDIVEKNTTYVDLPKCRNGDTGEAGAWVYDTQTRKVMDLKDYHRMKGSNY